MADFETLKWQKLISRKIRERKIIELPHCVNVLYLTLVFALV